MRRLLLLVLALLTVPAFLNADDRSATKWEPELAAFEKHDQEKMPPKGCILFIGSSSIRKWTTLTQDFPDLPVVNRGFGGSEISDSVDLVDRIVVPYEPKLIVMYAGGNDLHAKKTPETVAADFKRFVEKVRGHFPQVPIDYISISPNPSRWSEVEQVKQANEMIEKYCAKVPGLTFVNTFPHMLGADGQPLPDIFVQDRLHMNANGYALWTKLLRPYLDAAMAK